MITTIYNIHFPIPFKLSFKISLPFTFHNGIGVIIAIETISTNKSASYFHQIIITYDTI